MRDIYQAVQRPNAKKQKVSQRSKLKLGSFNPNTHCLFVLIKLVTMKHLMKIQPAD